MVLRKATVDTKDLVHSLIGNWIRWDRQTDAILISSSPCIPKLANNQMLAYNKVFATSAWTYWEGIGYGHWKEFYTKNVRLMFF